MSLPTNATELGTSFTPGQPSGHADEATRLAAGPRIAGRRIAVVVGNPKVGSRTLDAAQRVAATLTGHAPHTVVDLATLGAGLLGWGDANVVAAKEAVADSELVVFASPTFKATFTGLLKLFLEQFDGGTGLNDVVCVPLMLGAGPAHALAPELHLRPVLSELGGICALPGLYLRDSTYADDGAIDAYAARWRPVVRALLPPAATA